ncbi:MAG: SURF1 family protein [Pseudomonadales bacterium]|nr:SURF1 family protein [Pseudomonadales bacterium]
MIPQYLANFRPNWKITLFTALLLPCLIWLGFWQLAREQEKLSLQAVYDSRKSAPPVSLAALGSGNGDLQYLPVRLSGSYDNEHSYLLDNRTHAGQVGFDLISPFLDDSGETAFINRGWLAQGPTREMLPPIPAITGRMTLTASIYVPPGEPLMLGDETAFKGWPRVLQAVDLERMTQEIAAHDVFPYTLRLDENMPGVLVRNWPLITTSPEKHRAYAVQWFAMAVALVLMFIYSGMRDQSGSRDGGAGDHG